MRNTIFVRARFRKPHSRLARRKYSPLLERLECRTAPSVNVLTYRNNLPGNDSGANLFETQLTPANVNTNSFGQLFSYPVDGQIYGEPLIKTTLSIPGKGTHDVVFVATQNDSVYAFDADGNAGANATPLWHDSFINPTAGITPVPSNVTGSQDITPNIGITATMVIDPTSSTLYVVSKTQEVVNGTAHYVQRLHALDIGSGAEKFGGPALLGDTIFGGPDGGFTDNTNIFVPGTGDSSNGTDVFFNALRENERSGEFFDNGVLYLSFTSHGDTQPYHGWLLGFNPTTLALVSEYCSTPNGTEAAIWMGGAAPAVDASGNIFFTTGNGTFDAAQTGPTALGPDGGGLGYGPDTPGGSGGIPDSVAVKFDLFSNQGEGNDSTGLYTDGASPTIPAVDMTGSGITLQSSDPIQATLSYNGTTLTESLLDLTTNGTFSTSYTVNIPAVVGGSTAFVGFTGGTGGLTSIQSVQTWTFKNGKNGKTTVIDHSGGFGSNGDLTANGSALFTNNVAQLTDGGGTEAGSVFTNVPVNVSSFTTTFTFLQTPGTSPMADGMTFTIENASPGQDYGMSTEKVSPTPGANKELPVLSFFAPHDEATLSAADQDQGSGGVLLLPASAGSASHPNLLVQTGKTGRIYLLDQNSLGGFTKTDSGAVQVTPDNTVNGGSYDMPAFFNNGSQQLIYYMGASDVLKSFSITNGQINPTPFAQTTQVFGFPGATPAISANGTANGIVWAVDTVNSGTGGRPASGPAVLHAYDATTLKELYNSAQLGTVDQLGNAVKFVVPTVANGKVYVGTQTGLYVFGLIPVATSPPTAPTNLSATASSPTSVVLSWTNTATNARENEVFRSTSNTGSFVLLAAVNRNATTYTDTTAAPSTKYFYYVATVNSLGSANSNIVNVRTPIGPPVVRITGTGSSEIDLAWTATADGHYNVLRSTNGTSFSVIANVSANVTSFNDTGLAPGTYFYEIQGFDQNGQTATSNTVSATVGKPVVVNHSVDFSSNSDLTANGNAYFANISGSSGGINAVGAVLTDGFNFSQAGTVFTDQKVDIRGFTTTFTFQPVFELTIPVADGMTFIIQNNSPTALGGNGGSLGYQGIPNSFAVSYRAFVPSLPDSDSETELGENGQFVSGIDVTAATASAPGGPINFQNTADTFPPNDVYSSTLTYSGTTLSETITDLNTGTTFSTTYTNVNLPALVGGDSAFVGFGGGDGGFTLTNEVFTWTYNPTTQNLPPLAPSNLKVTNVAAHDFSRSDVSLVWTRNSYNETGYQVQRSTDGVHFTTIATLPANTGSYTDPKLGPGTYSYRVLAFNTNGNSLFSNVDSVIVGTPGATVTVDHSAGFASHSDMTANGSTTFTNGFAELTDGGSFEAGSVFETPRVGVTNFTTTFTFRMHDGSTPMADGMTFTIQGNSPSALGFNGGGLGYASATPGGPQGIPNSICIKFDLYSNAGEGIDSTGLFVNGDSPTVPSGPGDVLVDLTNTGIDLHSQDVFKVMLSYSGTTLTEKIVDTVTNASFTTSYSVNIAALVGGDVGYAGFTGGTGGLTTVADVQTWTYQFVSAPVLTTAQVVVAQPVTSSATSVQGALLVSAPSPSGSQGNLVTWTPPQPKGSSQNPVVQPAGAVAAVPPPKKTHHVLAGKATTGPQQNAGLDAVFALLGKQDSDFGSL